MTAATWVSVGLALSIAWPLSIACREMALAWRQGAMLRLGLGPLWLSAPLPALLLVLLPADGSLAMSWWLLGGEWKIDSLRRGLLAFTALLWAMAGLYARGYLASLIGETRAGHHQPGRRLLAFTVLWPLTLAGNLLLIVAEDIASFYCGFTLMTFAAYGLVVHEGSDEARRGGKAYLIMAVLGEGLILAGLLWAAGDVQTLTLGGLREGIATAQHATAMATLLWLGFGVKAGVIVLHVWLPLAHPVAPTPASAVLSGAMIKAGLVGWWYTLPLGLVALPGLGWAALLAGLSAAFAAALYGILQRHPKAVLAYSSVSQMGMLTALFGAGLIAPALWTALVPAVVLFAAHHGLNKGALFLGVGISEHPPRLPTWLVWGLLVLPGLSLTGALASGLAAKWAYKSALHEHEWDWLITALSWAAVGTTLLIARALWRQRTDWRAARRDKATPATPAMLLGWVGCVVVATTMPWWPLLPEELPGMPPLKELKSFLWPLGLGLVLSLVSMEIVARSGRSLNLAERLTTLPPGDLWVPYAGLARRLGALGQAGIARLTHGIERVQHSGSDRLRRRSRWVLARFESTESKLLLRWSVPLMVVLAMGAAWLLAMA